MTDKVREIADAADMIVDGYSFTKSGDLIHVLNLSRPDRASVLNMAGEALETSMDDIEICIVQGYFARNKQFMEELNA